MRLRTDMRLDRIGGILVIAGWALVIVTGLIFVTSGSFAPGTQSLGGTVLAGGLVLLAIGVVAIAIGGPRLLQGRVVRIGLVLLGIGLACASAAAIMSGASAYESIATLVLLFVGGWIGVIGAIVTVIGLLRAPGRPRMVGSVFLGGAGLCIVSAAIAYGLGAPALGTLVAAVGGVVIVAAGIGIGLLAIGGRADPSVVAA
jgi:hypothetical protein